MPRLVLLAALLVTGCAADFAPTNDLAVRDFSPDDRSTGGLDSTVAGDGGTTDLASRDQGLPDLLAGPDLAMPDLTPPPDLTPIFCDLGSASSDAGTARQLWVAEVTTSKGLLVARFDAAAGSWSTTLQAASLYDVTLAVTTNGGNQPLVVARATDSTLQATRFLPCTGALEPLTPIAGATSMLRPALLGGAPADLVFRGNSADNHLYHAQMSGATFGTPAQLSFLTNVGPAIARVNSTLHAIHVGTVGNQLYDGPVGGTGVTITNALSALQPAAVTALDGTLHVVFTGTDTNLYWTKLAAGGGWSAPLAVCPSPPATCTANSDKAPFLALDASGAPIVAFHGKDSRIYTASFAANAWSAPIQASSGIETSDVEPGIATGVGSAAAELVYVRKGDGLLVHARLSGGSWGSFTTVSTTAVQAIPALAASLP